MINLAGKTVLLKEDIDDLSVGKILKGTEYKVEDTWKNVTGVSWMDATGNYAALNYAMRAGVKNLPLDDNVYYGKINGLGFIIHESEIELPN